MSNLTKGKLLKVTLEYENEIHSLSGQKAKEWIDNINNVIFLSMVRKQNPLENNPPQFEIIPKTKD